VLKGNENEDHRKVIDSNVEWKHLAFSEFVAVASDKPVVEKTQNKTHFQGLS
jgi:hypothetical protein